MGERDPKLFLFALTERAIVDQRGGLSLISLIEGVTSQSPSADDDPRKTAAEGHLFAVSYWQRPDTAGEDSTFEQRIQIVTPDGAVARGSQPIQFGFTIFGHKIIQRLDRFPIGYAGIYRVRLQYRKAGASRWRTLSVWPVTVTHNAADVETASTPPLTSG